MTWVKMRTCSRWAALASLYIIGLRIPALSQPVDTTRVRAQDLLIMSGQEVLVDVGWMEVGRPYDMEATLESDASDEDSRVEVTLSAPTGDVTRALDRYDRRAEFRLIPQTARGTKLLLSGGGELGAIYRISIRLRASPAARMAGVEFIYSPHQNVRPPGTNVTAVVVHATVSPTLESTVNWFLAPESQVSAHYTVGKDGKIVQMVEDMARGWHAGVSELEGVKGVNDFSVGIEIVNLNDGVDPYTDAQYESVAAIIRHLREEYYLPDSRIVSHEHIARPVGRKSDPKGFDFQRLFRMLREP